MPRLLHRPTKYSLHKGTKQAVISLRGKRIYLGPFRSAQSHAAYQEVLQSWYKGRDVTLEQKPAEEPTARAASVSPATLREKRRAGSPLTINELVLVYRRHSHQYYQKNGAVTREATIIDDAVRFLRKHHSSVWIFGRGQNAVNRNGCGSAGSPIVPLIRLTPTGVAVLSRTPVSQSLLQHRPEPCQTARFTKPEINKLPAATKALANSTKM